MKADTKPADRSPKAAQTKDEKTAASKKEAAKRQAAPPKVAPKESTKQDQRHGAHKKGRISEMMRATHAQGKEATSDAERNINSSPGTDANTTAAWPFKAPRQSTQEQPDEAQA